MTGVPMRQVASMALALALAACATRPPSAPQPAPPPIPPTVELSPIHQGLSELETVWHVRAGLNVAALSCPSRTGTGIVADYNGFLKAHQVLLTAAYEAKADRYRLQGGDWQRALDTHMTRLYNHFAQTRDRPAYCSAAAAELKRAIALEPDVFQADSAAVLARLDRRLFPHTPTGQPAARAMTVSAAVPPVGAAPLAADWGVQLGAFRSRRTAEAAWTNVQGRSAQLARFQPQYEPAPGTRLVRLQVRGLRAEGDAIELCAHAAAAGFDCMPVRTH